MLEITYPEILYAHPEMRSRVIPIIEKAALIFRRFGYSSGSLVLVDAIPDCRGNFAAFLKFKFSDDVGLSVRDAAHLLNTAAGCDVADTVDSCVWITSDDVVEVAKVLSCL